MPTTSPGNASKPPSSKKRKSSDNSPDKPAKQPKIDGYFSQLYPVSSNSKESESQPVPLNDEQKRVLEMVVDEGKNVFFTGAAGTRSFRVHNAPPSFTRVCFLVTRSLLTRDREIVVTPSNYRGSQEEACEETSCRFCHSQHWNGCFEHRWYAPSPFFGSHKLLRSKSITAL